MDEQGDSTRQTTWRPFLSEPATLLHVVNGSRDPAVTLAPGYGAEGGSVGPLAINVPDAVDEAHWYVKPLASLPGHTPATSGGPGLPHAPLYVCSGFNRKHGTGDDRTTAPPDAYPLPRRREAATRVPRTASRRRARAPAPARSAIRRWPTWPRRRTPVWE